MTTLIESFARYFERINSRSREFVGIIPADKLFWKPLDLNRTPGGYSCGEYILRSAAAVEQTFGGITTRLWDDPFEWTLPEQLGTTAAILEYFAEVEATRLNGFAYLRSDEDLARGIPAPQQLKSIFELLLETIGRAEHFQGRAFSVFQTFSDLKLPRI